MYSPNDYGAKQVVWPKGDYVELKVPAILAAARERGRHRRATRSENGSTAIRAGKPSMALSNFDYSATLTESMLLGNVAVRSGKAIDYNPETGEIANNSEASRVLEALYPQGMGNLSDGPIAGRGSVFSGLGKGRRVREGPPGFFALQRDLEHA